ncbi:hypothetical protein HPP92_023773 [Vanilla planifolia]|uniref:non-specific serine/threonine protein kinase n=1 Tax=Vanilla planifolia TaxID=51239 RepID=A0A835UCN7_VANPL|nr:hypothetical protein HPP92_023773 [Vanilla planifolia]
MDPKGVLQNWVEGSKAPCGWNGVFCSAAGGQVQALNLSNMGLVGRLNIDWLMALPELRQLDLHGNFFYGNLSYGGIGNSSASISCGLEMVDLSSNNLSETISSSFLVSCPNLSFLNLSRNSISNGVFPFGASLRTLDVSRNKISDDGLLSYSLSSCGGLRYLNLSDNKFAGKLRPLSTSCTELAVLDLSVNSISGEIPANFFSAVPMSLVQLNLSHNNLSGDLFDFNFVGCGNITYLDISNNGLRGIGLPASLASCRQLEFSRLRRQ